MKKNGKRYRRIQKEKEARRTLGEPGVRICQEVDDINTAYLAMGQIIRINPIINDSDEINKNSRIYKNYDRCKTTMLQWIKKDKIQTKFTKKQKENSKMGVKIIVKF